MNVDAPPQLLFLSFEYILIFLNFYFWVKIENVRVALFPSIDVLGFEAVIREIRRHFLRFNLEVTADFLSNYLSAHHIIQLEVLFINLTSALIYFISAHNRAPVILEI